MKFFIEYTKVPGCTSLMSQALGSKKSSSGVMSGCLKSTMSSILALVDWFTISCSKDPSITAG